MSKVKVNKISPRTACGTVTLGDSGDTFTIPSGATITNSGTATGFGATGAVNWNTTVKTGDFTATTGEGYFLNTTSGQITVTLPAGPSAGDVVGVKDYAQTFDTNNCILGRNSSKIGGKEVDATIATEGVAITLVYIDGTQGWLITDSGLQSYASTSQFIVASGGNTTITCGDYKTHVFTGPGTFCVSAAGNPCGSTIAEYLIVAGGGSGGIMHRSAGAGGGGFRIYSTAPGCNSPLVAPAGFTVAASPYAVVVGAGAAAPSYPTCTPGVQGGTSSVFCLASAGGGGGGNYCGPKIVGGDGGSGGGGGGGPGGPGAAGSGNTPPVSPAQGTDGGTGGNESGPTRAGGGGGGAGTGGSCSNVTPTPSGYGGTGGTGSYIADPFLGPTAPGYGTPGPVASTRYFSGGGGGGAYTPPVPPTGGKGIGGAGGGGNGGGTTPPYFASTGGTTNTGGGGGGSSAPPLCMSPNPVVTGGSGIVMIRYKFQ